jgi:hypothetical protein
VAGLRHVIAMAPKVGKTPSDIVKAVIKASGTDAASALGEIGHRLPKGKATKPMNEEDLKTKERLGGFHVAEAKTH